MATAAAQRTECPTCGGSLTVTATNSPWCESCGWNVDPFREAPAKLSSRAKVAAAIGSKASRSLLAEFKAAADPRPRLTAAKALAYLISFLVHATTVALLLAGVALLLLGNIALAAVGVLLLALAWLFRPRPALFVKGSADEPIEAPALRRLADEVAAQVGTRPADHIVVNPDFNAGVGVLGWRRTRILQIGLPLFAVLQPQERVAVLAHEFGHLANGDPRRGALVGSALETLLAWHNVLAPADPDEGVPDEGILSLLTLPVNVIMTLLAQLPLGLALFLATLVARESQRGEYLADAMSARVAGKDAASSFFDKVRMEPIYVHAISATSKSRWVNGSLWDEMQSKSATYPESELRRARLRDAQLATRLDQTHPPTAHRVEAIEARPTGFAQYVLAQARSEEIDQELKAVLPEMQAAIIDRHLDSLYAG